MSSLSPPSASPAGLFFWQGANGRARPATIRPPTGHTAVTERPQNASTQAVSGRRF